MSATEGTFTVPGMSLEAGHEVAATLQSRLHALNDLQLTLKHAHWNVVGKNFRSAHLQLDELVATARQYTDEVAERANAIGISPNGKAKTVVESSGAPDYPDNWQSVETAGTSRSMIRLPSL